MARTTLSNELRRRAFSILSEFITQLEGRFGPRDQNFEIVDIIVSTKGPTIYLYGSRIEVVLGSNAMNYEPTFVANLAHESVHLLNPSPGNASTLEEGVAVDYELEMVGKRYGANEVRNFRKHLPQTYFNALQCVRELLKYNADAAIKIRKACGSLTGPKAHQITELIPGIGSDLAARLVQINQMRP